MNAQKKYLSDCFIYGVSTCLNVGEKTPIDFTTIEISMLREQSFHVTVMVAKYLKSVLLNGYSTSPFKIRTWLSNGDVKNINMIIIRADTFVTG